MDVDSKRFGCLPHPFHLFPASPTHVWAVCQTSYPCYPNLQDPHLQPGNPGIPRRWRTRVTDQTPWREEEYQMNNYYVGDWEGLEKGNQCNIFWLLRKCLKYNNDLIV